MEAYRLGPAAIWTSVWVNRHLLLTLTRREVVGRYRGSAMGLLWSVIHPLLMLLVYTFVFSVVFRARWTPAGGSRTEFALVLFAGLLLFNLFAECVNGAPSLIVNNANYVKKVIFPLELLPVVALGAALFHAMVGLLVWLAAHLLLVGVPPAGGLLLPVVIAPLALLTLGVCWFLASLGVYLRDVAQVTGIATTALMFLSPVFFPVSALPPEFRTLVAWNPLAYAIEEGRRVLYWGERPDPVGLFGFAIVSALACWLGFAWFQKTRRGFADVL